MHLKPSSMLAQLWKSFGFFMTGGGDDLDEALLGSSSGMPKSDGIKRDIIVTLFAMCISLFVRFLWLALAIAGDFLASDTTRFTKGVCSDEQPAVFLLFVTANAVPWVIYALHMVAEPLPVLITVWTMGKAGAAVVRPRR